MASVLIVDDDAALRDGLAETLSDLGHRTIEAASGPEALVCLEGHEPIAAVLLDLRMPGGMDGLEVLRRIRARTGAPPVTILTAHAGAANTIEAMRLGAFDHLTKLIGRDDVVDLIGRMLCVAGRGMGNSAETSDGEILVGTSAAMRQVHKLIGLVADSDATVLITGETGSGKELAARAIHDHGRRHNNAFIALNCAAIPAELLESELFGHARGAFTGAVIERAGAFRDAQGGTLFLDEIGDMPDTMQGKILRTLQERVVQPIGGRPVRLDVRIIAATHRDLAAHVRDGRFRQDLFYRLNVVPIQLPSLRERSGDILTLARHFLSHAMAGQPVPELSPDAVVRLENYSWPGNVRELRNAMERSAVLCRNGRITAADLAFVDTTMAETAPAAEPDDLPSAVARLEVRLIKNALQATGGNRAEAARRLGIHRQLLYAKARRYGLIDPDVSEERTGYVASTDTSGLPKTS